MPEYYGKMSVTSVCTNNKYFSAIHGRGSTKSNDLGIARDLSHRLPDVLDKANFYTYDLQRRR
ncbi:MAG: hypothetical protein GTN40_05485 [Candidatus Aenigmarchaeota archaeon]|nr:hypothetical protein [Candidatus Aenigmarchaeota archaeon]